MVDFTLEDKILKVSEFNELFDTLVSYQDVIVEGEISELNVSQSKWLFITIKDLTSQVEIFAPVDNIRTLPILKEGLLVHVYGTPHIHKKSGRFRITAHQILPKEEGKLRLAFELLRRKLENEGIFALERKRPLPEYPSKIALLTAESSEAYNDFIKILTERSGGIKIYFFPISVQGVNSISSITNALNAINRKYSYLDLAVITRGGGSLEDLQAFNSEEVVRAIFSSKIPVVSAIGHEKDVTLSDLVADLRASTPSNAAELIVREKKEILGELHYKKTRLENLMFEKISQTEKETDQMFSLIDYHSKDVFFKFTGQKEKLISLLNHEDYNINQKLSKTTELSRFLYSLNYENILKRGFSLTSLNGKILRDLKNLHIGDMIETRLYKIELKSKTLEINERLNSKTGF